MTPILLANFIDVLNGHLHLYQDVAPDLPLLTEQKGLDQRKNLIPVVPPTPVVPPVVDPFAEHDNHVKCQEGQRSGHTLSKPFHSAVSLPSVSSRC